LRALLYVGMLRPIGPRGGSISKMRPPQEDNRKNEWVGPPSRRHTDMIHGRVADFLYSRLPGFRDVPPLVLRRVGSTKRRGPIRRRPGAGASRGEWLTLSSLLPADTLSSSAGLHSSTVASLAMMNQAKPKGGASSRATSHPPPLVPEVWGTGPLIPPPTTSPASANNRMRRARAIERCQ
jgi:hypothetical protein